MRAGEATASRSARLAALGLFMALPLLLAALTGLNLLIVADVEARAAGRKELLAQLERRIATAPPAAPGRDLRSTMLASRSSTRARAELQQIVVAMIDAAGGRLIEAQTADAAEPGDDGAVRLRATFDASNDRLADLVVRIETGLPLLFIDEIGIRNPPRARGEGEADPPLRTSLTVRGHWRGAGE